MGLIRGSIRFTKRIFAYQDLKDFFWHTINTMQDLLKQSKRDVGAKQNVEPLDPKNQNIRKNYKNFRIIQWFFVGMMVLCVLYGMHFIKREDWLSLIELVALEFLLAALVFKYYTLRKRIREGVKLFKQQAIKKAHTIKKIAPPASK